MDNETVFHFIKARYIALLMIIGIILFFMALSNFKGIGAPEKSVIFGFYFYAVISFWILRNIKRYSIDYKKFIGFIPADCNWLEVIGIVFAIIIFSVGLNELRMYLLSTLNPAVLSYVPGTSTFYTANDSSIAPLLNFMEFFIGVIIAPIVEEFLFRGFLLHRFTIKWGIRTAVLASSFIFGILHADILGAFLFGLVMCILYLKTVTILVPIFCHMLNNCVAFGMEMLGNIAPKAATTGTVTHVPNVGLALFLTLFSGIIIIYYLYRNFPKRYWVPPYFRKYEEEY
ncbi:lysostaphin resistance A-like protein [Methanobacterium sp. MBAC-LM]|uniref:CPBP family intramembrane glutamic endopeptidase n=1 Tax=Methanobacterium sp. MBAC-LM TaxID=3412034 RepID=UPI003C76FE0A